MVDAPILEGPRARAPRLDAEAADAEATGREPGEEIARVQTRVGAAPQPAARPPEIRPARLREPAAGRRPERFVHDLQVGYVGYDPLRFGTIDLELGSALIHPLGLVPDDAPSVELPVEHLPDARRGPAPPPWSRHAGRVEALRDPTDALAGGARLEDPAHHGGLIRVDHPPHVGPLRRLPGHLDVAVAVDDSARHVARERLPAESVVRPLASPSPAPSRRRSWSARA
jgi:hypothetical protein